MGAIGLIVEDVYQLKLPVPFPLGFVASYLVSGENGWSIIDPGFDYPAARETWEAAAAKIGCDLDENIAQIFVTHLHPDHIGAARWMQELSGAPVYLLAGELEQAKNVWNPRRDATSLVRFLIRNGMDEETAVAVAATARLGIELPESMIALYPEDIVMLGDIEARIIHTPGHSDHHFVLYDERRRILFSGDQLLLEITPNIGILPYTAPQPLQRYLRSITELQSLAVDLLLPGHGPLFHDLTGRIDELLLHHKNRLMVINSALDSKSVPAYALTRKVFQGDLSYHQLRFALSETLAHLEYLVLTGHAEQVDGEVVTYRTK